MTNTLMYQSENSVQLDRVRMDLYTNFTFPMHIHRDLEFILVLEGEIEIITEFGGETAYVGEMALILSNQRHAFRTAAASKTLICTFSPSFVNAFTMQIKGMISQRCVFPCGPGLSAYLESCYLSPMLPDKLTLKASFYAICARYLQCASLLETPIRHDDLLNKLLLYVEENYRDNISLNSASRAIGYDENYLSRYFHQAVGINFRQFVNQYRVEYACHLMHDASVRMADVAMNSGFQNIRSFNRAFLSIMGKTPTEYMN